MTNKILFLQHCSDPYMDIDYLNRTTDSDTTIENGFSIDLLGVKDLDEIKAKKEKIWKVKEKALEERETWRRLEKKRMEEDLERRRREGREDSPLVS